jgi:hypothetical protein
VCPLDAYSAPVATTYSLSPFVFPFEKKMLTKEARKPVVRRKRDLELAM